MIARISVLAVAGVLLLAGCVKQEEAIPAAAPRPAVTGVRVEPARTETLTAGVEVVGTVRAWKQTVLSSKIVAPVVAIHYREGDRVRAGQVVVELDEREPRAQLRRTEAAVREARTAVEELDRSIDAADRAVDAAAVQQELTQTTLGRYRMLLDRRSVAPNEYDEVAARARTAAAELARARELKAALVARKAQVAARIEGAEAEATGARVGLSWARIAAPVDGIVVAKTVEVGSLATPGTPLVTLDEERYRLEVSVPESDMARVRMSQRASVTLDLLGRDVEGRVVEIVPAADPASRSFIVKLELPHDARLRSGLYGRARFAGPERRALLVPRMAVGERGQLRSVFVVDGDNVARLRLVTTGKTYGERVEVLSGLAAGERVAVEGVDRLADGSRVETVQ